MLAKLSKRPCAEKPAVDETGTGQAKRKRKRGANSSSP